jgi:hypothetical protein
MKDDLVREIDGSIRYCDSNIVKLGYWWLVKYKVFDSLVDDVIEAFKQLGGGLLALLFLLLLPSTPFIKAYFRLRQAKDMVEYHNQSYGDSE